MWFPSKSGCLLKYWRTFSFILRNRLLFKFLVTKVVILCHFSVSFILHTSLRSTLFTLSAFQRMYTFLWSTQIAVLISACLQKNWIHFYIGSCGKTLQFRVWATCNTYVIEPFFMFTISIKRNFISANQNPWFPHVIHSSHSLLEKHQNGKYAPASIRYEGWRYCRTKILCSV